MNPPTLDAALGSLPRAASLPIALPPVHLSIARWFETVVGDGEIKPRLCGVFNRDLIYLFYGGVFYRTTDNPTRNASELPVAFLFSPSVLLRCDWYYPFDTGAMAQGRYGDWAAQFTDFKEELRVASDGSYTVASRLVSHLYGTNEKYLVGEVDPELQTKPEPLPKLYNFLCDDLSDEGVDSRQCRIECISSQPLVLSRELLWVGYPDTLSHIFARVYEHTKPFVPESYQYMAHKIAKPSEVAAKLELKAEEVVKRYISLPPAGARV